MYWNLRVLEYISRTGGWGPSSPVRTIPTSPVSTELLVLAQETKKLSTAVSAVHRMGRTQDRMISTGDSRPVFHREYLVEVRMYLAYGNDMDLVNGK